MKLIQLLDGIHTLERLEKVYNFGGVVFFLPSAAEKEKRLCIPLARFGKVRPKSGVLERKIANFSFHGDLYTQENMEYWFLEIFTSVAK